ncbi:hypothetical protein SUGI_1020420 [Cryptomeria japonica]|nr:hypothetical protein SUGI_1020420 [Cryptomeria japonica]
MKPVERKKVKWTPPPLGWKKVNFDGASKGNPGLFGYGAAVRDEKGRLVRAVCGQVGIATNNIAEITALEEGLKWATSNGVMKKLVGFVREEDAEAVGVAVLEVEEEWANILGPYFNPTTILSDIECSEPEDEAQLAAVALKLRKEEFMVEAWEVVRVGVTNSDMEPFKMMMQKENGWLLEGSTDKVVTIGMRVATILRLL